MLFSFVSTAAVAAASVSPSHERSYLSPQFHRPATPFQARSTPEPASNHPTSKTPPAAETSAVETNGTDSVEVDEVDEVDEVESRTTIAEEVKTRNNIRNNESHESAKANPSRPTVEDTDWPIEQDVQDEAEKGLDQTNLRETDIHVPLSNRIHIIGFNIQARFFAHALASTPDIPINILAHHPTVMSRWGAENRELSLYDNKGHYLSSTRISCPKPISDPSLRYPKIPKESDFLDNIIIDTTTGAVLPSLKTLRHRIDHQTTICLLHPGLGLVEKINEVVFPDPYERPNFILAHSTHRVAKVSNSMYSIKQRQPGTLYLYGVPKFEDSTLAKSPITDEGLRQSQHFIKLLSSTETLNVVSLPEARFLSWKLPWLIFSSISDSICVILGITYNQIRPNRHARTMWENLLEEALTIISKLPELQAMPHRIDYFMRPSFRRKMRTYLIAQGANASPWVKHVRMGTEPPVDYFNGYLVRRAEELGLNFKHNNMALQAVKARLNARQWELRSDLLGMSQYMTDTDTIGGGQPAPNLDDDIDFDLD